MVYTGTMKISTITKHAGKYGSKNTGHYGHNANAARKHKPRMTITDDYATDMQARASEEARKQYPGSMFMTHSITPIHKTIRTIQDA